MIYEWMGFYSTGHVVRASGLIDDIDLKVEHLQIKHIDYERDETNMQPTLFIYIKKNSHIIMYTGISQLHDIWKIDRVNFAYERPVYSISTNTVKFPE